MEAKARCGRREGPHPDARGAVGSGKLPSVPVEAPQDVGDDLLGVFEAGLLRREGAGSVAKAGEPHGTVRSWLLAEEVGERRLTREEVDLGHDPDMVALSDAGVCDEERLVGEPAHAARS